jgi:hypothetical protein
LFRTSGFSREFQLIVFTSFRFRSCWSELLFFACQSKVTKRKAPPARVLRMPSAIFAANGSSRLAIRARRDSIGRPWPIDPTSKAVFGALKGELSIPLKSAEAFGFDRANRTGTSDLVLWSPDGDSGRPVGKGECRGYPKGKSHGCDLQRNSPARRNQRSINANYRSSRLKPLLRIPVLPSVYSSPPQ